MPRTLRVNSATGKAASRTDLGSKLHGWGSPHLELARLTVDKLPIRPSPRVNSHTRKKAVMIAYCRAGSGRAVVDKRATFIVHGGGYSCERVIVKRLVSALCFFWCDS